eukprot:363643-Chlamydomonas_euryale.AAC.4
MFALVLLTLGGSVMVMVLMRVPNNEPSPWLKACNTCLQVFSDFGVVVCFPVVLGERGGSCAWSLGAEPSQPQQRMVTGGRAQPAAAAHGHWGPSPASRSCARGARV